MGMFVCGSTQYYGILSHDAMCLVNSAKKPTHEMCLVE